MASIKISDLHPAGSDLFSDSESYLNELSESEEWGVKGGMWPYIAFVGGFIAASAAFGC